MAVAASFLDALSIFAVVVLVALAAAAVGLVWLTWEGSESMTDDRDEGLRSLNDVHNAIRARVEGVTILSEEHVTVATAYDVEAFLLAAHRRRGTLTDAGAAAAVARAVTPDNATAEVVGLVAASLAKEDIAEDENTLVAARRKPAASRSPCLRRRSRTSGCGPRPIRRCLIPPSWCSRTSSDATTSTRRLRRGGADRT